MLKTDYFRCSCCTRVLKSVLPLLFGLWLAGCGSAPIQEMSDARQAIDAARAAGAVQYAPGQLEKAESELESAEMLLHDRHFSAAGKRARNARDEAIRARKKAEQSSSP